MFQIILSSNSSLKNYPNNSGECFHADLNKTLHFNFNKLSWEVALSELFIIPNSWNIIRESFNYVHFRISGLQVQQLILDSTYVRGWLTYKNGKHQAFSDAHGGGQESELRFKGYYIFPKPFREPEGWRSPNDKTHYVYYYVQKAVTYEDEFMGEITPGVYSAKELLAIIVKQGANFFQSVTKKMRQRNMIPANLQDIYLIENAHKNVDKIIKQVEHPDGKLELIIPDIFASKLNMQLKLSSYINFILGFTEYLYQPE